MYCPNCGQATAMDQKFCRACGLSVEKAAQSLIEQLPAVELEKKLRDRKRRVDRLLYLLGGSAAAAFVVIIFWTVIQEIIIGKGQVLGGSVFLAFILGIIVFAVLMLYREWPCPKSVLRCLEELLNGVSTGSGSDRVVLKQFTKSSSGKAGYGPNWWRPGRYRSRY